MLGTIIILATAIVPPLSDDRMRLSATAVPKPPCMCRLRSGERVPLGTRTCLRVGGREYLAECRVSQNVSTWREIAPFCATS